MPCFMLALESTCFHTCYLVDSLYNCLNYKAHTLQTLKAVDPHARSYAGAETIQASIMEYVTFQYVAYNIKLNRVTKTNV